MADTERGAALLQLARTAIAREWDNAQAPAAHGAWLREPGATFVTLTQQGGLRGCMGSLEAHRPLLDDVQANARAAAFRDPRFAPLCQAELRITRVEVSLLSPMQPLRFANEIDALNQLQPGIDGVVFEYARFRSTFLPQVWEQLPDPKQFIAQLKAKAGLPGNFWSEGVRLFRYTVSKFTETELHQRGEATRATP